MYSIAFKTESGGNFNTVPAVQGEKILDLARNAGLDIDAPCAGNGTCGKCRVRLIDGSVDSEISRHISADDYEAGWRLACASVADGDAVIEIPARAADFKKGIKTADLSTGMELELFERELAEIFASGITRGCAQRCPGLAVDIGTTTVTAALLDLESGKILAKASSGNGQIRYGADVINRIINSSKPGGREALQRAVREETVIPLISELSGKANIMSTDIVRCVIAGNTTMEHLLVGEDAETIRLEPYVPAFLEMHGKTAQDLGLPLDPSAPVILAPNVGSYVGGDITAGTLAAMLWNKAEMNLFIDLGTNGELVLGNADFMLCCACSAGPAFEGGDISCGMRATRGAVDKVSIDKDTMEPTLTVIGGEGGVKPVGLCGSGIIDLISELFRCGIINAKGRFARSGARINHGEYGASYVLAFAADSGTGRDIELTEADIESFIRAKGALYSAIVTMLRSLDMTAADIENCYIAGGIGSGIDIEKAITIGMLPNLPTEKYRYLGNTSLNGAAAMLLSDEATEKVFEISRGMTYLELSSEPGYMDEFIAACFLPHTDASQFVKELR